MKLAMSFRLNTQVITILSSLEKKLHASKTEVIEEAVRYYAKEKLAIKNPMLDFAGILSEQDAKKMLNRIHANRKNKKIDVLL